MIRQILVDPIYNPNFLNPSAINSGTKLAPGVSIAKFLGAYGNRTSFNHVNSAAARQQIARQLYLHAELYRSINGNTVLFNDVRLVISEGLYRAGPDETLSGGTLDKSMGITTVYQVFNKDGTKHDEILVQIKDFKQQILTTYNDTVQSKNELIEALVD